MSIATSNPVLMWAFEESDDGRDWGLLPEALSIRNTANQRRTDEAIRLAHDLVQKMPDFDFPYNWLDALYCRTKTQDKHGNLWK